MSFERDVFISYAHIDNRPLSPEQKGWISRFHDALLALLSMRLGRQARIWRDDKLTGTDVFSDEIVQQFNRTALLAAVLTPRYLASEWCTKEVRGFCEAAEHSGGLVRERKSRVLKVLKTPVDSQETLPAGVKDILGYEFYALENGVPLELDAAYGERFAQDYNRTLARLAWEAKELLSRMETDAAISAPAAAARARATVYLAECAWDQRAARDALDAELRVHGYRVLPDRELPKEEAAYVAQVQGLLEQSTLSIHLVGTGYGAVPDGPTGKSVVVLQNALAAQRSRGAGLRRLIWLPEGTDSDQPAQQAFIAALHGDAEAQLGADLVTGGVEELKRSMHETLRKLETPERATPGENTAPGTRLVYLICDRRDRPAVLPLRKALKELGVESAIPAFEGSAADVREANQSLLKACSAVILYYGAGDEAWKRTLDSELKKAKAYRDAGAALSVHTCLGEPTTPDKQELVELGEPNLIDTRAGIGQAQLSDLMRALGTAAR